MTEVPAIDILLTAARKMIDRVPPEALETEIKNGAIVIDTRPLEQRTRDGRMPGAVVINRKVLEWRWTRAVRPDFRSQQV